MEPIDEPAASVIVPTHRGAHRLPVLLDALAAQDVDEPWEVVVVLDGVLDDSPRLLEQWQDRLDLRIVVHPEPLGLVDALNDGYAAARGRVLIRCDDDLTPGPDMVRRHIAHHTAAGDVGVMGPTRDVFPRPPTPPRTVGPPPRGPSARRTRGPRSSAGSDGRPTTR